MLFSKRIAALETEVADLKGQLHTATEENTALQSENTRLSSEAGSAESLTEARAALAVAEAGVADLRSQLGTAASSISALTAERDSLNAAIEHGGFFTLAPGADGKQTLTLSDVGKIQFVNDEATRVVAKSGHGQMPLSVDSQVVVTASAPPLKGRERLRAATRAEFAK